MKEILECECGEVWKQKYYGIVCPNCGKMAEKEQIKQNIEEV